MARESTRRTTTEQALQEDIRDVLDGFRNVVKALRLADRAGIRQYGLGSAQIYVLHQLRETSPLSINELARLTATDQSSVSVVVNKLAEKGLISSSRSANDARKAELVLTRKGRAVLKRIPAPFQASLIESVSRMPAQKVRELAATLRELAHDIGAVEGHAPMFFADEDTERKKSSRSRKRSE